VLQHTFPVLQAVVAVLHLAAAAEQLVDHLVVEAVAAVDGVGVALHARLGRRRAGHGDPAFDVALF